MSHVCEYSRRPEEGVSSPKAGVTVHREPPDELWSFGRAALGWRDGSRLGALEEQQGILATELSFQLRFIFLVDLNFRVLLGS